MDHKENKAQRAKVPYANHKICPKTIEKNGKDPGFVAENDQQNDRRKS